MCRVHSDCRRVRGAGGDDDERLQGVVQVDGILVGERGEACLKPVGTWPMGSSGLCRSGFFRILRGGEVEPRPVSRDIVGS